MSERGQWGSRLGFILAAIGSAIGLGNIWRFPYVAASNGGGAFLIPYLFALLTAGIPILILEFSLGHKTKSSAPGVFGKIKKQFEFLGWFQTVIPFIITTYYIIIIAWAINYCVYAFTGLWGTDTKSFFFSYLQITESPWHFGGFNWIVFVPLAVVWIVNYVILISGVKGGIEKANKIFMPLLIICIIVIAVRGITLPGALAGLDYFFKPDFSALLNPEVWIDAYGQIFYSLSICFGVMLAYSSYLPKKTDIVNNAFITGFGNCSFSLLSGIAVFSVLGFMAKEQGVAVEEVAADGIGLAFIVFPQAINALPGFNELFGVVFFLCLIFAGLSSSMSIMETFVAGTSDKFNISRKKVLTISTLIGFILSIIYTTGAGLYILDIVDHFINNYAIAISGLIEIIILVWFVRLEDVRKYANEMSDFAIGRWWNVCLTVVTPILLSIMFVYNTYKDFTEGYEGYPTSSLIVMGAGCVVLILVTAFILKVIKGSDTFNSSLEEGVDM